MKVKFKHIQRHIELELEKATNIIDIASAWISNKEIQQLLLQKAIEGVKIRIVFNDDLPQFKTSFAIKLINAGVELYVFYSSNTKRERKSPIRMHHKFIIIDGMVIITGSYNLTFNAEYNLENIIITKNKKIIRRYLNEFKWLITKHPLIHDLMFKDGELMQVLLLSDSTEPEYLKKLHTNR